MSREVTSNESVASSQAPPRDVFQEEGIGDVRHFEGLSQRYVSLPVGEVVLTRMEPDCDLPSHRHLEGQFGFAAIGAFDFQVGEYERLETMTGNRAYTLASNITHGARSQQGDATFTLDLKLRPISNRGADGQGAVAGMTLQELREAPMSWGQAFVHDEGLWSCRHLLLSPGKSTIVRPMCEWHFLLLPVPNFDVEEAAEESREDTGSPGRILHVDRPIRVGGQSPMNIIEVRVSDAFKNPGDEKAGVGK